MDFTKPKPWIIGGVVVGALFLLHQFWLWEVERVTVPPGNFLVLIKLWGKDLPDGEIIAPDDTYKGIQREVLPEGNHFLNPLFYTYEIHKMVSVPTGQRGVLTRKFGKPIPMERYEAGDIMAREGERGIVAEPLKEGNHRINPHAYDFQLVQAIEITAQQVGVRTLKVGKDPRDLPANREGAPYLVPAGYQGVQMDPLPPGRYLINPHVESIVSVDLQERTPTYTELQFPTQDGFLLNPHVKVTYQILPEKAPSLLVKLTDEGKLYQEDATPQEIEKNPILQKVVLPLVRGFVRIEGSKFLARDFIAEQAGATDKSINARKQFEHALMEKVPPLCKEEGIIIKGIALDKIEHNNDLAELAHLIGERQQAQLMLKQNEQKIAEYKKQQELEASKALSPQKEALQKATTRLQVAKTKAEERKEVEEKKLLQELENTKLRLESARDQAKGILLRADAEAKSIDLQNQAEVSGLKAAIQGFPTADAFAQYHVLMKLAPTLSEIFASDTSDFARLFSGYMTPPNGKAAPGAGGQ